MTIVSFIVTLTMVWWLVLFIVLPFGVRTEGAEKGHASSAPQNPHLLRKFIITTVLALFITWLMFYLARIGMIDVNSIIGRG